MLQAASQPIEDYAPLAEQTDMAAAPRAPAGVTPVATAAPERYRARSRPNLPAIAAILIIHALAIGALIQVRNHVQRMEEAKLTVVNLTPPPPPPAAETPPPPPSTPQVVAPPPIVHTPAPPVPVQTTPDPVPVPVPSPVPVTVVAPSPSPASIPFAAPAGASQNVNLSATIVSGRPPRYPIESRRKREQGTVKLGLIVAPDGSVEKIWIAGSSGFDRLDDAALDAVRRWRWAPLANGKSLHGWLPIPFVLRSDAG